MSIPRPEYPRPQMVRSEWLNLNGEWQFEIDQGDSGRERGLPLSDALPGRIIVPFCPESELSGIGCKDFMQAVWYKRRFTLPSHWEGKRIILHFGAVDYEAEVWINGQAAGSHTGGYASFQMDVTKHLRGGENQITVCARDDIRRGKQPHGKQSRKLHSYECSYTRTTGIWQTVWLEPLGDFHISRFKLFPDPSNSCLHIEASVKGMKVGCRLRAAALLDGTPAGETEVAADSGHIMLKLPVSPLMLWGPGKPVLYDLLLTLEDSGEEADKVSSYFGMRSVTLGRHAVLINGKPVFQRLVLDQGFYPDGIYTASSDAMLKRDIELSMALGFNGARMHQKVFEQRFLYWADRLGYLIWGEYADTGLDLSHDDVLRWILPEWQEIVERDFNSTALVVWCPLNEVRDSLSGTRLRRDLIHCIYRAAKVLDPTRPVVDASGFMHVETDIFDVHEYEQDTEAFSRMFGPMRSGGPAYNTHLKAQEYKGQPYMVSEYGGTWWSPGNDPDNQMSYGAKPSSGEEFIRRFTALTNTLLSNPAICGFCYTQLYDVEQEVNGLCTYARKPKFDPELFRAVLTQAAAIEADNANGRQTERQR